MNTISSINMYLQRLPEPFQEEVLFFIRFLIARMENNDLKKQNELWSSFSLNQAMRGMEDEDSPVYGLADIKERF